MDKYGMWMCYGMVSQSTAWSFWDDSGPILIRWKVEGRALENVAMALTADERKMLKGWRRKNTVPSYIQGTYL